MQIKIATAGDSWCSAHESGTETPDAGWPEIMGIPEEYRFAVGGTTAKDWLNGLLDPVLASDADVVVWSAGGNDVKNNFSADRAVETFKDLEEIHQRIMSAGKKSLQLWYAVPSSCGKPAQVALAFAGAWLTGEILFCSEFMRDEHFSGTAFPPHPNRAGHEVIAQKIERYLRGYGNVSNTYGT